MPPRSSPIKPPDDQFFSNAGTLDLSLQTWSISKWSDSEILAENDDAECVSYTLSINLRTKQASGFRRGKGTPGCEAFSTSPKIIRLVSGEGVSNEYFQKRGQEAFKLMNPRFYSGFADLMKW
jgi:hypothetical protein